MAEYLTNTADLTAVADAIRAKGGTTDPLIYPGGFVAAIESLQTGGGANELLEWFGGSKYYTTTVTPTSNVSRITITPDDATILDSPKFLLVTQDIPADRNVAQTRAIARAPSLDYYISATIAFTIGRVYAICFLYDNPGSPYDFSDVSTGIDGGDVFDGTHGIQISGGSMTAGVTTSERHFKGGQPYKVLLIG